eukprot:358645-Pelagomonas_calceolata.AAC.1
MSESKGSLQGISKGHGERCSGEEKKQAPVSENHWHVAESSKAEGCMKMTREMRCSRGDRKQAPVPWNH